MFCGAKFFLQNGVISSNLISELANSAKIVVFMRGTAENPLCFESKYITAALKHYNREFTCIDIMESPQIKHELEKQYPWTPQVYCGGYLLGGANTIMELQKLGSLERRLSSA
mmetsp:Transcript_995/g.1553  ORF Transcript_995/g.1553 Transcript_995/m.1553 type:complete len:113 (+) Transcript_995:42-380(+)